MKSVVSRTIVASLLGTLVLVHQPARAQTGAAAPTVIVTTVRVENVAPVFEFVGRVEATDTVDLRARVDGFLKSVMFVEGQDIKESQPLIKIEDNRYQALVKAARGAVAQAKAKLDRAGLEVNRLGPLVSRGATSQARLDDAKTDQASAEAALLSASADLDGRLIDLKDTTIQAPISGRIGRSRITVGNLVSQSTGSLARIVALDPIRVVFSVAEDRFVATRRAVNVGGKASHDVGVKTSQSRLI